MKDINHDRLGGSSDRSTQTFGKTELYLLLLLFVGGIVIDFGSHLHSPQQPKLEPQLSHWLL